MIIAYQITYVTAFLLGSMSSVTMWWDTCQLNNIMVFRKHNNENVKLKLVEKDCIFHSNNCTEYCWKGK